MHTHLPTLPVRKRKRHVWDNVPQGANHPYRRMGCIHWLILLISGFVLLIGVVQGIASNNRDNVGCLHFQDSLLNNALLDLRSGAMIGMEPADVPWRQSVFVDTEGIGHISPDGLAAAYGVDELDGTGRKFQLYIRPASVNPFQLGKWVSNDVFADGYQWSPNSQWLAYFRLDTPTSLTVGIASERVDRLFSQTIPVADNSINFLQGWSADSRFLALTSVDPDYSTYHLRVWSIPDFNLMVSRTFHRTSTSSGWLYANYVADWSPQGHWLAVLGEDSRFPSVTLLSPGGRTLVKSLMDTNFAEQATFPPMLIWSPDGEHLAVTGTGKSGYHLDLVSKDDSIPLSISDRVTPLYTFGYNPGYYEPNVSWSADSQSLLYAINNGSPEDVGHDWLDNRGDFLAYNLQTQHTETLATHIFLNFQQTPDHSYAFVAWLEKGQIYSGVVRTTDGVLLAPAPRLVGQSNTRSPDMYIKWLIQDQILSLADLTSEDTRGSDRYLNVKTGEPYVVEGGGTLSPDKKKQVLLDTSSSPNGITLNKLILKNADGTYRGEIRINTSDVIDPEHPGWGLVWSLDSQWIAFSYSALDANSRYQVVQVVNLVDGLKWHRRLISRSFNSYEFGSCDLFSRQLLIAP